MSAYFPVIKNLDDFRLAVSHKDEIKFNVQPNSMTVGCYMVAMPTTFDTSEARECRGIVFDHAGQITSRPLHKFFNVGEKESTRIENIDWSKATRIMTKRDGSMIHTVKRYSEHNSGEAYDFELKSKKSFSSDVALAASKLIDSMANYVSFCNYVAYKGYTAIFEYTAPTARIVLYYPTEKLVLLHVRDNMTGQYLGLTELNILAEEYGIEVVAEEPKLLEALKTDPLRLMEETEGVEGWVIQFQNGDMVKLKTKWYLTRHRAMTFLRERDIAKLVISEGTDDLKSLLVAEGADISEIESIETRVVSEINEIGEVVTAATESMRELSFKDAAIYLQSIKHQYFGLVMSSLRGKEADIKGWYLAHVVDAEYSLRQLNIMQTIGEPE